MRSKSEHPAGSSSGSGPSHCGARSGTGSSSLPHSTHPAYYSLWRWRRPTPLRALWPIDSATSLDSAWWWRINPGGGGIAAARAALSAPADGHTLALLTNDFCRGQRSHPCRAMSPSPIFFALEKRQRAGLEAGADALSFQVAPRLPRRGYDDPLAVDLGYDRVGDEVTQRGLNSSTAALLASPRLSGSCTASARSRREGTYPHCRGASGVQRVVGVIIAAAVLKESLTRWRIMTALLIAPLPSAVAAGSAERQLYAPASKPLDLPPA
jgi:hypothetical protein